MDYGTGIDSMGWIMTVRMRLEWIMTVGLIMTVKSIMTLEWIMTAG